MMQLRRRVAGHWRTGAVAVGVAAAAGSLAVDLRGGLITTVIIVLVLGLLLWLDRRVTNEHRRVRTLERTVAAHENLVDAHETLLDRIASLERQVSRLEAAEQSIADFATKLAAFDAKVEQLQSDVRAAAAAATAAREAPRAIEGGLPRSTPLPAGPVVEPLVSVIVTCFDEADYLRTCLTSIEIQDLDTFECVIVDDGSGDASPEIAAEFVDRDRRFRLLRHAERLGPSAGRNTGLAAARGRFAAFMDADDFMYQGSLGRRLATAWDLDEAGAGSYCDWTMVEIDAVPTVEERHPKARPRIDFVGSDGENPFIVTAPLMRMAVARAVGGFNESMTVAEDFEFWIRVLRHGFHFEPVSHVGVAYRQKPEGNVRPVLAQHVEMAGEIYRYLDRELAPSEFGHVDQPIFNRPLATYQRDLQFSRRLVTFLALAILRDNSADITSISARFPASIDVLPYARLDVETRVRGAAARFAWQDRSQPSAEVAGLQFRVREQLERIRGDRRQLRLLQQPHDDAREARPAAGERDGVGMPTWLADEWDAVAGRATEYVPGDQ